MRRTKFSKKQAFFALLTALVTITLLESGLKLLAMASPEVERLLSSPWSTIPQTLPDPRLGHRPSPEYPGHDRNGFRNPNVPIEADIIGLGDSQTYGTGVEPRNAWPRQLESMTGEAVYSMAFGGYGPTHSLILWNQAVALRPKVIIEAFYAGNDLYDSFNLVYNRGLLAELKSRSRSVQSSVRSAEESESIAERVSQMYAMGETIDATSSSNESSPLRFLSLHSRLYGLLRRLRYAGARYLFELKNTPQIVWQEQKLFAEEHSRYAHVFEKGQYKTLFTSEYRLSVLDLQDPRIAEGLQISLKAIRQMNDLATADSIRFLVVLIPTKESVFRDLVERPTASYRSLIENEELFLRTTVDFLDRYGIEYVDALPALRKQFLAGSQPYQPTADGHPNVFGHRAIAELISNRLRGSREN